MLLNQVLLQYPHVELRDLIETVQSRENSKQIHIPCLQELLALFEEQDKKAIQPNGQLAVRVGPKDMMNRCSWDNIRMDVRKILALFPDPLGSLVLWKIQEAQETTAQLNCCVVI